MAKTEFLQIRVTPEDLVRIREAAEADHLDTSTWARRVILRAVDSWDLEHGQRARSQSASGKLNDVSRTGTT